MLPFMEVLLQTWREVLRLKDEKVKENQNGEKENENEMRRRRTEVSISRRRRRPSLLAEITILGLRWG